MAFTSEQNEYILRLYAESGNSPSRAIELFKERFGHPVTYQTLRGRWRDAGYKPNRRGGQRYGLTEEKIRILHDKYEGDIGKMLEELGRTNPESLVQRCRELELIICNIPKIKRRESEPFPGHIV
tara:strand:+ start:732 stop:1106 length:375 start_codon:yes stop_codon:yes gene_type:complete